VRSSSTDHRPELAHGGDDEGQAAVVDIGWEGRIHQRHVATKPGLVQIVGRAAADRAGDRTVPRTDSAVDCDGRLQVLVPERLLGALRDLDVVDRRGTALVAAVQGGVMLGEGEQMELGPAVKRLDRSNQVRAGTDMHRRRAGIGDHEALDEIVADEHREAVVGEAGDRSDRRHGGVEHR
jgi:hypothetical protein